MSIRKFRAGRVSTVTADEHVGQFGDVFYDEATGQFRVSNGTTPGGTVVATALDLSNSTADLFVNNITVAGTTTTVNNITSNNETTLTGVLTVTGNAEFNGNTTTNGHFHAYGPSEFTGDTTFIGNVTEVGNLTITGRAINNGPSVFNGAMTITGDTGIVGNIIMTGNSSITGNTFVTGPTTVTGDSLFSGNLSILVPVPNSLSGAVSIIGNNLRQFQSPIQTGVMLQVTGQQSDVSRIYMDGVNNYNVITGRRYNGTPTSPTGVKANNIIARYGSNGLRSDGTWNTGGVARMEVNALEDFTPSSQSANIVFYTTAIGSTTATPVVSIDNANGIVATKATVTGNLIAGNVISNTVGTLYGNVNGTILTPAQPNITSVGTLSSLTVDGYGNGNGLTVQGNLRYDINYGNATVTQLTSKSTAVTANGRTGQITTSASSLAKGVAVTFTVNNNFITAVTDVPVVAIQSGATFDSYAISVTRVQVGSFNITITNNGASALADTMVINFAIMRIS